MKSWLKKILVVLAVACMVPPVAYAAGQNVFGTVSLNASFTETVSAGLITPASDTQSVTQSDRYTNGTGSGQIDTLWATQVTLAGAPQTFDLTTLTDPSGQAANFARVREFIVQNTAASTKAGYDVKVSAAASSGVSWLPASASPLMCRYGSVVRISDKFSTGSSNGNVVGASAKSVTLDPGANTVVVNIIAAGCSSQ